MDDFEREIRRRSEAALEAYDRGRGRLDRGRHRAREALQAVLRRFVQADLHSQSRLQIRYLPRPGTDAAVGYALVWAECPPARTLTVRADEASGEICWELASPELHISEAGSVDALDFRPEFLDRLIYALFEQDCWERAEVPSVEPAPGTRRSES